MSLKSRREERRAVEVLKASGIDVTKPELVDRLVNGGSISYTPDGSVSFLDVYRQSYAQMYRKQAAFRSVVDFLSRNVGGIHMKLSQRVDKAQIPRPDHEFMQLIDHPSPGVSYSKLMTGIVADRAIYGAYAVWKIRENFFPTPNSQGFVTNSGQVVALVRIPIPFITIQKLSLTAPLMFQLTAGDNIKIRPEDMIWGTLYDPDSNLVGTPPAESLRQILAEEWAAAKNQENMWKRGPHGNSVFIQDANTPGLDVAAAENFKTDWNRRYGGVNAESAGTIPLMPVGIKPETITFDAQDQQYLQMRNFTREEVCHTYGFNPALLGITPSNFASADSFHQQLYQDTLTPICVAIQEDFEEQLLYPDFVGKDYDWALDFNITSKLQGSFLEQAKIGQQAVGGPWMTMNEFRTKFQGLPPQDGGDEIIIPLNVVRGGGPQPNPQASENQFTKSEPEDIDGVLRLAARREQ